MIPAGVPLATGFVTAVGGAQQLLLSSGSSAAASVTVLQLLRESNAEATVVAPTYRGKWWPLLQELLIGRVELPSVRAAFRPGRSGHVEPWRLMGSQSLN